MVNEGDLIFSYSRKQAIEDGVLVDVSSLAKQVGSRYPVAVTRVVWDAWIVPDEGARRLGETEQGRLWDLLWVLHSVIKRQQPEGDRVFFSVLFTKGGKKQLVRLKSICGPGDNLEPVVTIMPPEED